MHGNVWEWVWDAYQEDYEALGERDPVNNGQRGSTRVRRGGSWYNDAFYARAALRINDEPGNRLGVRLGFRLARSAP